LPLEHHDEHVLACEGFILADAGEQSDQDRQRFFRVPFLPGGDRPDHAWTQFDHRFPLSGQPAGVSKLHHLSLLDAVFNKSLVWTARFGLRLRPYVLATRKRKT